MGLRLEVCVRTGITWTTTKKKKKNDCARGRFFFHACVSGLSERKLTYRLRSLSSACGNNWLVRITVVGIRLLFCLYFRK